MKKDSTYIEFHVGPWGRLRFTPDNPHTDIPIAMRDACDRFVKEFELFYQLKELAGSSNFTSPHIEE